MSFILEQEFQDIDSRNAWGLVYQQIRNESNNFNYTIKDAKKAENKNLNRYRDVNPYDHSRVHLEKGDKDYINASLVRVPAANRAYILTQGPLPITTGHFWLMAWEQKSKAVIMLNRVIEKNTVKCHQYWPLGSINGGNEEETFTDVGLKVTYLEENETTYYTVRKLVLTDIESAQSRIVLHFHYTTWPDFGVPESPSAFLNFLIAVQESGALETTVGPAIVHCSAGIGRSGTFCLVDSCLVLIKENGNPNLVNVTEILLEMRRYRMGLIQTPDQLRFSYQAIIQGAKFILAEKDMSSDISHTNEDTKLSNQKKKDSLGESVESEEESEDLVNEASDSEHSEEVIEPDYDEEKVTDEEGDAEPPPLPPRTMRHLVTSSDMSKEESEVNNSVIETNISEKHEKQNPLEYKQGDGEIFQQMNSVSVQNDMSRKDTTSKINDIHSEEKKEAELRKRKREERKERTAELVQKMRRKQQESEAWLLRRRSQVKGGVRAKRSKRTRK